MIVENSLRVTPNSFALATIFKAISAIQHLFQAFCFEGFLNHFNCGFFLMVGQPTSKVAFFKLKFTHIIMKSFNEQFTAVSLFHKNFRSVHRHEGRLPHEGRAANQSITAGGVARQDANSKTGRRSGHPRQRQKKRRRADQLIIFLKRHFYYYFKIKNQYFHMCVETFRALQANFFCFSTVFSV